MAVPHTTTTKTTQQQTAPVQPGQLRGRTVVNKQTEAMKLALETFQSINHEDSIFAGEYDDEIAALREALADQPVQPQEPVAWIEHEWSGTGLRHLHFEKREPWVRDEVVNPVWTPLYTSPPAQRKPLTDEQIKTRTDEQIEATFKRCGGRWNGDHWVIEDADLHPFVRTIEGADLNTLRAISDEYNAWIKHHAAGHSYDDFLAKREAVHSIKEQP